MAITFRLHALERMFERGLSVADVAAVVETGEIIAELPERKPQPSRTLLGWQGGRPIHVVCVNGAPGDVVVITAYVPDPLLWDADFRKRIK